jgi:Tol biopolymer transport system component
MKKYLFALLASFLLLGTSAVKADAGDQVKLALAKQKFYGGQYVAALNIYKELMTKYPEDPNVQHYVGTCYYALKQFDKAMEHFIKGRESKDPNTDTYLYLGKLYQSQGKLDKAIEEYTLYKGKAKAKDAVEEDIDVYLGQCNTAKRCMESPVDVKVENMGPEINSKYDDQSPAITADGMKFVFNTRRPETTDSPIDAEGDGKHFQDIYISSFDTTSKKWKVAEPVSGSVNTDAHDACTGISADGKQIFIYKNDINNAQSRGGDIFVSKITSGKWKTPEPMGKPINTSYWEGGASISPDGKTLYFTSERLGGQGSSDIWMAKRLSKTEWDKPVNLGALVNSPFDEVGVVAAPDGKTLFFCSNGNGSMGSYDIFKTTFENGKWTKPENLGYPINSGGKDGPFVLSADARTGYFASDREGGMGESDIYKVDLSNYAVLEKDGKKIVSNGLSIVKGTVRDGYEGYGLPEVEMIFTDESGQTAGSTNTNENGEYFMTMKGGVKYTVTMKKKGFKDLSETFDLKLDPKGTYSMDKEFLLKK